MKTIYKLLGGVIAIAIMVATFKAYIMRTIDLNNHILYDGLGRVLSEPPIWAQILVTEERVWAGLGWHLFDVIWFFGGLGIAAWLFLRAEK